MFPFSSVCQHSLPDVCLVTAATINHGASVDELWCVYLVSFEHFIELSVLAGSRTFNQVSAVGLLNLVTCLP